MGRRRADRAGMIYDVFADMSPADQAAALRIMTELHRQATRTKASGQPGQSAALPATAPPLLEGQPQ